MNVQRRTKIAITQSEQAGSVSSFERKRQVIVFRCLCRQEEYLTSYSVCVVSHEFDNMRTRKTTGVGVVKKIYVFPTRVKEEGHARANTCPFAVTSCGGDFNCPVIVGCYVVTHLI